MRFWTTFTALTIILLICLAGPVEAKGGKGGGRGGGKSSFGGGARGGGSRDATRPSQKATYDGKNVSDKTDKTDKKQLADSHKPKKEKKVKDEVADSDPTDDTDDSGEPTTYNKKEKQLANFQRQRDKKLAQAEHLREIAERNGNANLAANADRMEAQAHAKYAEKVAHLEKFGVTDPALDPDGDVTDPLDPDGDPLTPGDDPLVEDPLDDPLGVLKSVLRLRR